MYLKALACDLDGTLAENGKVDAETWAALRAARKAGLILLLVTGRRLDTFAADGPFAEVFEAIVAENGAAVYLTRNDSVVLPFGRLAPEVRRGLEALAIPLEWGLAIAATWVPHDAAVADVLRETGGGATLEFNKGAVMVLPPGATKGTGLRIALEELGYSPRNVIAIGDAENDRSLFEVAEVSVAVSNAVPGIRTLADLVLPEANGVGSRALLDALITGRGLHPAPRPERRIRLGLRSGGEPLYLSPFQLLSGNLAVAGASGSGKSWLAGLVVEELLRLGYQVCIIDPEGDYLGLRAFPHTLVLTGPEMRLPPVVDVVTLSEYTNVSLVLDLSRYEPAERDAYVLELMQALRGLRARRGRPHWFLLDEVHSFCPPEGGPLTDLILDAMQEGGVGVVSYRPSQVAPAVLEAADGWLLTRLLHPEEAAVVDRLLARRAFAPVDAARFAVQPIGKATLFWEGEDAAQVVDFQVARRVVPHVRHLHKYLQAPLPPEKRFYFRGNRHGRRSAASLWEFREALAEVPARTLQYHLERRDFERWLKETLHDDELARRIRKIRRRAPDQKTLPGILTAAVARRYEELESLI